MGAPPRGADPRRARSRLLSRLLRRLRHDPLTVLRELPAGNGGVARVRVGRQDVVVVFGPAAVRELLVERASSFAKHNVVFASGYAPQRASTFLHSPDRSGHVAARRVLAGPFSRNALERFRPALRQLAAAEVAAWPAHEPFAVEASLGALAGRALATAVLGAQIADPAGLAADAQAFTADFRLATSYPRELAAYARPATHRSARAHARLLACMRSLLERAEPDGVAAVVRDAVPGESAPSELLGIVLAGLETTAAAAASALWLLALRPQEQEALRADAERGSRRYARAVFTEALRLYPPSWFIGRRALEAAELSGAPVEAGSVVLVPVPVLQRDPRRYERPDEFVPARWLDASPPADAFLPFGLGLRRCLGEALAWIEGEELLAAAALAGRLSLAPGAPPAVHAGASLHPAGLRLLLAPRAASAAVPLDEVERAAPGVL